MPSLAYPFAAIGAAAGWLSTELIDYPVPGPASARVVAAGVIALIAALAGLALQRPCTPREGRAGGMGVGGVGIAAGAAAGAVTVFAVLGSDERVGDGAGTGIVGVLVLSPVLALIVAAARRAATARRGSLVARSGARGVWAVTAAAIAAATLAAVPDEMAGEAPPVAHALAGGALAVIVLLLIGDALAVLALRRARRAAAGMALLERDPGEAEGAVPAIDLGVGAEVRAQVAPGAAAYRAKGRVVALIRGSFTEARRAIGRGLAHDALACAAAVGVLAGHAWAEPQPGGLAFHEIRCKRGSRYHCAVASAMLREGAPEDLPRAVRLDAASAGPWPWSAGASFPVDWCPWYDAARLQHACEEGDINSCAAAVRAREAAKRASD